MVLVRLDPVDEVAVQRALFVREAVRVVRHPSRRQTRLLDEFPHAALVDRFRDLLGGLDLVRELLDFRVAERVVGGCRRGLPALLEVRDVLRDVRVEGIPQLLEAVGRAFAGLGRAQVL
ncbi:hypothetical protein [Halobacterium bonnevillei]|uniref:hypothetical protein n=1 Tax=Halobacterium bonnevillei TaxID=2692200 RepID=UPI001F47A18A|nr:hypothetical protein [Halobacterium bonnevillei]